MFPAGRSARGSPTRRRGSPSRRDGSSGCGRRRAGATSSRPRDRGRRTPDVGVAELEDEARLRLDEMRVLIAFADVRRGDLVASNGLRDVVEIGGAGHHLELCARGAGASASTTASSSSLIGRIMSDSNVSAASIRTDAACADRGRTSPEEEAMRHRAARWRQLIRTLPRASRTHSGTARDTLSPR